MSVEIPVIHAKDSAQPVSVSEAVFAREFNEPLVHQLVTTYLTNGRAGTKAQKNRSAVSGGGKKPWRQKGTGRARAGSIRSPIWRGGGVTFAASPRKFHQKLNKKMYRAGMRAILSELLRQQRLGVSADLIPSEPKTKVIAGKLREYELGRRVLILVEAENPVLERAVRNVPNVQVSEAARVDPVSLVAADKVVMTAAAAKILEERLA
ncbi:large subunit ribosomal protein L4 [Methylomarinovum tepidoasis]|uniref:Large ribosomal subunit protein uL4 n=1 Tax=Methylomarinovum tepidoasis TaxID=2840183 RepID=A0AAU9CMF4_9GAMM|nr:50S ribosomal protein L4 [Methylomarinovum sp. IN45]BCX88807.1 large subunit ribosomal protein L4 [Methylomarinovum sp. IN45]